MARVTHVNAAQQRYEMVPVLDENGEPRVIRLTKADGSPKVTKHGREITRSITVADKSQPLPNYVCDKCGEEIKVGQPYKWIKPKSGPYGGSLRTRCDDCPTWRIWEYSYSTSARLAEVSFNFGETVASAESEDDVQSALNDAAEAVREIATEKEESADNMEEGFGHETSMSAEIRDVGEQLNSWADEIENAQIPEFPETEEGDCAECGATGVIPNPKWVEGSEDEEAEIACDTCDGTGQMEPDEPTEDQITEWRDECLSDLSIVDESPV